MLHHQLVSVSLLQVVHRFAASVLILKAPVDDVNY